MVLTVDVVLVLPNDRVVTADVAEFVLGSEFVDMLTNDTFESFAEIVSVDFGFTVNSGDIISRSLK